MKVYIIMNNCKHHIRLQKRSDCGLFLTEFIKDMEQRIVFEYVKDKVDIKIRNIRQIFDYWDFNDLYGHFNNEKYWNK